MNYQGVAWFPSRDSRASAYPPRGVTVLSHSWFLSFPLIQANIPYSIYSWQPCKIVEKCVDSIRRNSQPFFIQRLKYNLLAWGMRGKFIQILQRTHVNHEKLRGKHALEVQFMFILFWNQPLWTSKALLGFQCAWIWIKCNCRSSLCVIHRYRLVWIQQHQPNVSIRMMCSCRNDENRIV